MVQWVIFARDQMRSKLSIEAEKHRKLEISHQNRTLNITLPNKLFICSFQ